MDDKLDKYIDESAATGKPYSVIYQELVRVGWNPGVVASRINSRTETSPKPSVNKISPLAVLAISLVVIALVTFIVVSIWASGRN